MSALLKEVCGCEYAPSLSDREYAITGDLAFDTARTASDDASDPWGFLHILDWE